MLHYQEYQPSKHLADYIDCFWYNSMAGDIDEESPIQRCLPLGMVELIIHLEGRNSQSKWQNHWTSFSEAYVVGIMQEAVEWKMYGQSAMFGVRFKPEGVIQLFQTPLAEFVNNYIDAEDFLGKKHSSILGQIQSASTNQERVFLLEAFIHHQLVSLQPVKNHFTEAIRYIRKDGNYFTTNELENKLFVCERQAQRIFKNQLGLSPKEYFRIIRFRQIIDLIKSKKAILWADLAYSLGYSDQAHLIRDFKQFAGLSPVNFVSEAQENQAFSFAYFQ
jgi:AraC-like DNA-binding protein